MNDCPFCRVMRSFAFTGIGMTVGATAAYFLGGSREQMAYAGMATATILIFGIIGREKRD